MRFSLGRVVATPGAMRALEKAEQLPAEFLDRHVNGDWGEVPEADKQGWAVVSLLPALIDFSDYWLGVLGRAANIAQIMGLFAVALGVVQLRQIVSELTKGPDVRASIDGDNRWFTEQGVRSGWTAPVSIEIIIENVGGKTARNVHVAMHTNFDVVDDDDKHMSIPNYYEWQFKQKDIHPKQRFVYRHKLKFRVGGRARSDFNLRFTVAYDDHPTSQSVSPLLIGVHGRQ
jgi:hypothetical protein